MASKIAVKRFKIEAEIKALQGDINKLKDDLQHITFSPLIRVALNMVAAKEVKIERLNRELTELD